MNQAELSKEKKYLALVSLMSILTIMPIFIFGVPDSIDLPQHFKFARIFYDSFNSGNYFPNWAGNENFGYGDIGIRFYPPLEYYFLAFARILFGNWYDAACFSFVFWMSAGCLGVYLWARNWLPQKESALAACFYAVIPFHLNQLYVSFNNYSEFAAASILTVCFAFLTRLFKLDKKSDVLGLAISYALLILTHLPLTLIGSLSLFIYALILLRKDNFFQSLVRCALALALALAASCFYWVQMISEMKWLNHTSERFSSGRFSFDEGFFPFFYHSANYRDTAWIIDIACLLTLIFLASAAIYPLYKKRPDAKISTAKEIFQTILPLACLAFLMVTPFSRPVWTVLTPLQKVQFPVRWMTIVSMCGAVIAAAAVHYLVKGNFFKHRIFIYGCIAAFAAVALYNFVYIFHPTSFVPQTREKFESMVENLPENTSFECWWTIWARRAAVDNTDKISAENRQIRIDNWETESKNFTIGEGKSLKVRVATFYYPLWQATVNNVPVEIEKDENGVMLVPLSEEKSDIKLVFQEPLINRIASIVSIATWLILFLAFLFFKYKKSASLESSESYFVREETTC